MGANTRDLGVSHQTVKIAIIKVGGKPPMRLERPFLTPTMKEPHLLCCKTL
uniref:Uncharacterized protein n=1 Tax=Lepeophtheirus salmonis TaxID=72036 RepID=A0A0K2T3D1_LEPSM